MSHLAVTHATAPCHAGGGQIATSHPCSTLQGLCLAIVRSTAEKMELELDQQALTRVALWALDLSDAYRMLAVNRSEWWLQQFLWTDGVRLDKRCIFGSANLPGFFERVTLFLLKVAGRRIDAYDAQHPYSLARQR